MFSNIEETSPALVTGVFCEIFSAADAVRALNDSGFEDRDIDLIGVLSGRAPDLSWFLVDMGVPADHADYYNSRFEDGAILVLVRTAPSHKKQVAQRVLKRYGGTLPAEG
ncbi:MAG: hypothetical protein WB952_03520 [Terriglobales bacterium]